MMKSDVSKTSSFYKSVIYLIFLQTKFDSILAFSSLIVGRIQMQQLHFLTNVHSRQFSRRLTVNLEKNENKSTPRTPITRLFMSGYGIATNYTWKEGAYEIDVTVSVPKATRAKDIFFKATSRSIDLRLVTNITSEELILLDGSRKLRGRIDVDGTYWVIADDSSNLGNPNRKVTVTIEKIIATPKDDFDIVDYDWNGLYHVEDADEVIERRYDKPEALDVRQYAAEMGVDIDNLNMSMVDKNMFNSGLNLTKSTLKTLHQSGYLSTEEVTQQADGTEFISNDEGELERVQNTPIIPNEAQQSRRGSIPFLDTDSQWNKVSVAISMNETLTDQNSNETVVRLKRNFTRAAFAEDSSKTATMEASSIETNPFRSRKTDDPIDALTVVRLKEILKAQGLKTSGTKIELQERLRNKVNALLQGNDQ
jgi:SAP domain/CS domain